MKNQDAINTVTKSLDLLSQAIESGRNDVFERQLELAAKFYQYSFSNVMMIHQQSPNATCVAGYHAWKKLGRWVNAGESGIAIFAPIAQRKEQVSDEISNQTENTDDLLVVSGFRVVYVFDVSQTDGAALVDEPPILGNPGRNLDGLIRVYQELKIKLEFARLPGSVQGYSLGGEVRIREGLDDSSRFRVLVHELAHEMMHKTIKNSRDQKSLIETEAESVAFVVSSACGVRCLDRSADYIALHQGDSALLVKSLGRIQKTASNIIDMIEVQVVAMNNQSTCAAF